MRKLSLKLEEIPEKVTTWCEELGLKVNARFDPSGDEELFPNRLVLEGDGASVLGANRGAGLDALQYLLHEAQGEREEDRLCYLDAQGMRLFRMKELKAMAQHAAIKAREIGVYSFSSLSPRERRWVHLTIARSPDLTTESEGTGTHKTLKVMRKA